jgi:hypothetical protein
MVPPRAFSIPLEEGTDQMSPSYVDIQEICAIRLVYILFPTISLEHISLILMSGMWLSYYYSRYSVLIQS